MSRENGKRCQDMRLTEIRLYPALDQGTRLACFVSVVLNGAIAIHGIRIVKLEDRLLLAMPCRKSKSGRYEDIVHPVCHEMRAWLEDRILGEYEDLDKSGEIDELRGTRRSRIIRSEG